VDVQFSEEELLLRDSILGQADKGAASSVAALESYDDAALWDRLAASGALGLGISETLGGAGSVTDASIAATALGRATTPVPYLGCALLPAHLLALAGADPALIDALVSGRRRVAVGIDPHTWAIASESSATALAWDSAGADAAVVRGADGRGLVAVAIGTPTPGLDLTRRVHRCNLSRRADVTGRPGAHRGDLGGALDGDAEQRWYALTLALTAADMVGVMEGALALAVEHAKTREQFGVPIGSFQAIQHLLAEQHTSLEGARSVTTYAAWSLQHRGLDDARLAAHTAKAYCADAGKRLCEAVVQVHGGMGMTWECRAHVFLKRMMFDRTFLGDEHLHFRRIAELRSREARRGL